MNKKQLTEIIVRGYRSHELLSEVETNLGTMISSAFSTLANISPESAIQVIAQLNEYIETLEEKIENDKLVMEETLSQVESNFEYSEE